MMKPTVLQCGFTLIEIIIALALLSILTAFGFKQFSLFSDQSAQRTLAKAQANIQSAMAISHIEWMAKGGNSDVIFLGDKKITLVNGYPRADVINAKAIIETTHLAKAQSWSMQVKNSNPPAILTISYKGYCFNYTETITSIQQPILSSIKALPC